MIRQSIVIAVSALCLLAAAGCDSEPIGGEQPKTEVYLLVDLSETWNNPANRSRNEDVLRELGAGVAIAAETVVPPLLVQHRAIGQNSYERAPLCDVEFVPTLVTRRTTDKRRMNRQKKLAEYLSIDCPAVILVKPPENRTEILATLRSVADQPKSAKASRRIIVASDFLEESFGGVSLEPDAFAGASILLLYRPLAEDQVRPVNARARVEEWAELLRSAGAKVKIAPDTALRRSQIVSFVLERQAED